MSIGSDLAAAITRPFTRKAKVDPAALVNEMRSARDRLQAAKSILSEISDDLIAAESEQQVLTVFRRRAEARAAELKAMADLSAARLSYDTLCQRVDIGGPGSLR